MMSQADGAKAVRRRLMSTIVKVESEVPFGRNLYACLYLRQLHLDTVVRHNQVERHYLAWETVRRQINPFFQKGTGFEGYLVGRCSNSAEALEEILVINQNILDAIARLYRFQYGFRSRLIKTLTREASDSEAIHIWSAYLGAELGKLRAQILQVPVAQAFRARTYRIVRTLPQMIYHEIEGDVTQTYVIGSADDIDPDKLAVSLEMLKSSQQDAWLVAEHIGEFGHPLVRRLLDHV